MKKPDIVIFLQECPDADDGLDVAVRLGAEVCACPACIGQVVGELLLRGHSESEYLAQATGREGRAFLDYAKLAMRAARCHTDEMFPNAEGDHAAEEAAAADVGQGDDAPTPAEDGAPTNSDPWARPPDVAIHAMVQGAGRVMACKIGNSAPIDAGSVGAYCAVLLQTAYTCSNGEAEPFDVFCANVLGQMHRALRANTRLVPDAPEN